VIALVDYGAGNLTSVRKALAALGAGVWTPTVPGELARAHGIIVPGVGHFDTTRGLTGDWRSAIAATIADGTPLLGICVGLQWLFEGSVEAPGVAGLGVFAGVCQRVGGDDTLKVPHVGWNTLEMAGRPSRLLAGLPRSITVVLIEHDMDVALAAADRVTVMHQGRVIAEGTPAEISADVTVQSIYLGHGRG